MYVYEIISDADVPVMTDLGEPIIQVPAAPGRLSTLVFPDARVDALHHDGAAGATCRVIRSHDGRTEECSGAVHSIEPVTVWLDGIGFH